MSAAAQTRRATGKMRAQFFNRAARFELAVPIGETNDAVRIRNVQKLGIVTRRVKCNPEWFVQIAFRKYLSEIRLTAAFCIAQYFDLVATAFGNENISIGRGEQKTWIAKPARIELDFETSRNLKLRVRWTPDDARRVNCQDI